MLALTSTIHFSGTKNMFDLRKRWNWFVLSPSTLRAVNHTGRPCRQRTDIMECQHRCLILCHVGSHAVHTRHNTSNGLVSSPAKTLSVFLFVLFCFCCFCCYPLPPITSALHWYAVQDIVINWRSEAQSIESFRRYFWACFYSTCLSNILLAFKPFTVG